MGVATRFRKLFCEGEALPFTAMERSTETVPCANNQQFIAALILGKPCCVPQQRLHWLEETQLSALQECLQQILIAVLVVDQ